MNLKISVSSELSEADLKSIQNRGITKDDALKQLQIFCKPNPYTKLLEPCTIGKGIRILSEKDIRDLGNAFNTVIEEGKVAKFVPGSGAATRMFQSLTSLNHAYDHIDSRLLTNDNSNIEQNLQWFSIFIKNIKNFAFYEELKNKIAENGNNIQQLLTQGEYKPILRNILDPDGLNYANLPKGLILFHKYGKESRTALEEQILESLEYTQDKNQTSRIHFTFASGQSGTVERFINRMRKKYQSPFRYVNIDFSYQKPSTDTIAVDLENRPLRDSSGNLVFSPGGHGALLENLNSLESEIIFLKNIDNAAPDHIKPVVTKYKKALGGLLIVLQKQIFEFIHQLSPYIKRRSGRLPRKSLLGQISDFTEEELNISIPEGLSQDKLSYFLWDRLNRPLRVCGVICNNRDPGGCPFWTANGNSSDSVQIVEESQVNLSDDEQNDLFLSSSHFNPVDIVCSFRNYRGQKFNLSRFVDPNTYFISVKSIRGVPMRILERPGLWNGSMWGWNTVLAEVPSQTFLPVKQVLDLLKPEHLGRREGRYK